MELPKELMDEDMKKLNFVNWDRFVFNDKLGRVDLFGWIKRDDSHEDFVILEYNNVKGNIWKAYFSTSSKKYSQEIFNLLKCEGEHANCQRVEEYFSIDNCIIL